MKIYVGFSAHIGFAPGSWALRLLMGVPFSHTYFKFKDPILNDNTVFHAIGKGVNYVSEPNFLVHNKIVKEIAMEIDEILFYELLNECHENASKDYAYLQNIGILGVRILARFGINIKKNPFTYGINCSEWISYILRQVDSNFNNKFKDIDDNLIGPDQIFNYFNNL